MEQETVRVFDSHERSSDPIVASLNDESLDKNWIAGVTYHSNLKETQFEVGILKVSGKIYWQTANKTRVFPMFLLALLLPTDRWWERYVIMLKRVRHVTVSDSKPYVSRILHIPKLNYMLWLICVPYRYLVRIGRLVKHSDTWQTVFVKLTEGSSATPPQYR